MLARVPDKSQTSSRLNVSPVIILTPIRAVVWAFKTKMYVTGSIQDSYVLWAVHAWHANPGVCDSVTQLFASGYRMSCWWSGEWVRRCYWFHPTRDAGHLDKIMSVSTKQIRLHCMCVWGRFLMHYRLASVAFRRNKLTVPAPLSMRNVGSASWTELQNKNCHFNVWYSVHFRIWL